MAAKKPKKPDRKQNPPTQKTPRGGAKLHSADDEHITWHLRVLDRSGPWGWERLDLATLWETIHGRLSAFESMTWAEVMRTGSHPHHPGQHHAPSPETA